MVVPKLKYHCMGCGSKFPTVTYEYDSSAQSSFSTWHKSTSYRTDRDAYLVRIENPNALLGPLLDRQAKDMIQKESELRAKVEARVLDPEWRDRILREELQRLTRIHKDRVDNIREPLAGLNTRFDIAEGYVIEAPCAKPILEKASAKPGSEEYNGGKRGSSLVAVLGPDEIRNALRYFTFWLGEALPGAEPSEPLGLEMRHLSQFREYTRGLRASDEE